MKLDQELAVLLCDLMSQLDKHLSQVTPVNRIVIVLVEKSEDFDELLILFRLFDPFRHKVAELVKINRATVIIVCVLYHLAHFFLRWVLTERPHNRTELLDRNCLVSIDIEHFEDAPKVLDLLLGQIAAQSVHLLSCDAILVLIVIILRIVLTVLRIMTLSTFNHLCFKLF